MLCVTGYEINWRGSMLQSVMCKCVCVCVYTHTGCNRRNGPDFGRVFLMLNYTEKPQNTNIQS